jgi:hypothetical protein
MTHVDYDIHCPQCGRLLTVVALDAQSAPWVCNECHLGFWAIELTDNARLHWGDKSFERGSHEEWLRQEIKKEYEDAVERGTSLREDHFLHAHVEHFASAMLNVDTSEEFKKTIKEHLKNANQS